MRTARLFGGFFHGQTVECQGARTSGPVYWKYSHVHMYHYDWRLCGNEVVGVFTGRTRCCE